MYFENVRNFVHYLLKKKKVIVSVTVKVYLQLKNFCIKVFVWFPAVIHI